MNLPITPSFRLDGKSALVSDGTKGLGLASAVALAEAGAAVTVLARTSADVTTVVTAMREAGFAAEGVALDVTNIPAISAFVEGAEPFDILVNSAGMARHSFLEDITEENFDTVMNLNLKAALFLSKAVAASLRRAQRPGSIINISSQMGHVGGPKRIVYSSSKFAMEGMTKAMALELGPVGIRVNTICPTFVETELTAGFLADPDFRAWVLSKIKLGRLGQIEDIMGPVVFLASEASSLITGAALMVDGGWTAE